MLGLGLGLLFLVEVKKIPSLPKKTKKLKHNHPQDKN